MLRKVGLEFFEQMRIIHCLDQLKIGTATKLNSFRISLRMVRSKRARAPRDVNRAVRKEHHKIPTRENGVQVIRYETFHDIGHETWILAYKSSRTTTFNTITYRYCIKRLPLGLHFPAEVLENRIEQKFRVCPTAIYCDMVVTWLQFTEASVESAWMLLDYPQINQ